MLNFKNLERDCADSGFLLTNDASNLAKGLSKSDMLLKSDKSKIVNTITKAIGVLSADGPFAYIIWLEYKGSQKDESENIEEGVAKIIHQKSFELLKKEEFIKNSNNYKELREIFIGKNENHGICHDIYQMFLVKGILEKMLTYALYSARALEVKETKEKEE